MKETQLEILQKIAENTANTDTVPEAPVDGRQYGRELEQWTEIEVREAPHDALAYVRVDADWVEGETKANIDAKNSQQDQVIASLVAGGSNGGSYSGGDGIEIFNNTINVDVGNGLEISPDGKLSTRVIFGGGLTDDVYTRYFYTFLENTESITPDTPLVSSEEATIAFSIFLSERVECVFLDGATGATRMGLDAGGFLYYTSNLTAVTADGNPVDSGTFKPNPDEILTVRAELKTGEAITTLANSFDGTLGVKGLFFGVVYDDFINPTRNRAWAIDDSWTANPVLLDQSGNDGHATANGFIEDSWSVQETAPGYLRVDQSVARTDRDETFVGRVSADTYIANELIIDNNLLYANGPERYVGIGTTIPEKNVDIYSDSGNCEVRVATRGDGEAVMILDGDKVGTNAEVGELSFRNNGDSIGSISVSRRDADDAGRMNFKVQENAGGSIQTAMYINPNGRLFVNDFTPSSLTTNLLRWDEVSKELKYTNAVVVTEAPSDGSVYLRKDNAWTSLSTVAGASILNDPTIIFGNGNTLATPTTSDEKTFVVANHDSLISPPDFTGSWTNIPTTTTFQYNGSVGAAYRITASGLLLSDSTTNSDHSYVRLVEPSGVMTGTEKRYAAGIGTGQTTSDVGFTTIGFGYFNPGDQLTFEVAKDYNGDLTLHNVLFAFEPL